MLSCRGLDGSSRFASYETQFFLYPYEMDEFDKERGEGL